MESFQCLWNRFGVRFALEERDPARRDQIFPTRLTPILCRAVTRLGEPRPVAGCRRRRQHDGARGASLPTE